MTLERAREIMKDYISTIGLVWPRGKGLPYLDYRTGQKYIVLDGEFDADTLEAISIIMRGEDD